MTTTFPPVGVKIGRGDYRPWTEKWLLILSRIKALQAVYSGDTHGLGNLEIDSRALDFFVECDHLRDWLEGDLPALPSITPADIDRHFQSSQALRRCNAVCNSHKHHTRRSGTTARIRDTEMTGGKARVTIEVDWASPSAAMVDALDLAEDCVADWRAFFTAFGIAEPL